MAIVVLYHCAKFQPNRTINEISRDISIFGLSRFPAQIASTFARLYLRNYSSWLSETWPYDEQ